MKKDCGIPPQNVQVDGGMTSNKLLMQLQSDLIGLDVIKPDMAESTALVSIWRYFLSRICDLIFN